MSGDVEEPIVIVTDTRSDGMRTTRVASWPRVTSFHRDIWDQVDPALLSRNGPLVTVVVGNGQATYVLGALDEARMCYPARLLESWLRVP